MIRRALERSPIVRIGILAALCVALGATPPGAAPQPVNGVDAVVSAFGRVPIVALGVSHTDEDDEFAVAVVRDPRFARTVRNVVIECGNSLYQPVLDRYIAGDDVPLEQLQLVWRNTTQVFGPCNDPHHKELLDAVRAVNRALPADRRIRVLAGDPPIDWDKVHTTAEFLASSHRDDNITSVIETQVVAKGQKALLFFGGLHVYHRHSDLVPFPTVTERLEQTHPHSTYVFMTNNPGSAELDRRFASWPNPSAAELRGTWLGAMDANDFAGDTRIRGKLVKPWPGLKLDDMADAYLYLGPAAARHENEGPPESDAAYARELERRTKLLPRPGLPSPNPAPTPASRPRPEAAHDGARRTLASVLFVLPAARVGDRPAFHACAVRYHGVDVDELRGVRAGLERHYPRGTREYFGTPIDFYVLSASGRSDLSVDGGATFRCTESGLSVRYAGGSQAVVYPRGSRVFRETASPRYFVKPGEAMPPSVRDGIRRGMVRFAKTL